MLSVLCKYNMNDFNWYTRMERDLTYSCVWCVINELNFTTVRLRCHRNILSMAAPEAIQVSSLPLPPVQYINLYSDENVRRGRAPRPPPPIHDSYSMFGNVFNADDTIIRPLEAQGIKRLYPQHFDRRRELKKLNHSLLVNFLDLIDLLVQCPDSPRRAEKVCIHTIVIWINIFISIVFVTFTYFDFEKFKKYWCNLIVLQVEDLSLLFIHIHHLLNEFRPHQARETLRVMMELQRRQRLETALRFQKHLEKVYLLLKF